MNRYQNMAEEEKVQLVGPSKPQVHCSEKGLVAQISDDVLYSEKLRNMIKAEYPTIYKLWEYNPCGTLAMLQASEAVTFRRKMIHIDSNQMSLEGNDNVETWKQFYIVVKRFWWEVNDSSILEKAREYMTNQLYNDILKKHPKWPTVEKGSHEAILEFDKKHEYRVNDATVYWTALGYIKIKDIRRERRVYYTECESDKVTLKVLRIQHSITSGFEKWCSKNWDDAKIKVAEKGRSQKMIKWQNL